MEFVSQHLSRGNVEHLKVINNKWVKIYLKSATESDTLWFSIGSVDTFERNLEHVQADLGIEQSRNVPVLYKSQMEMSK